MTEYQHNLNAFKTLIDKYTIADINSMVYDVPVKDSGACCYPAMQALISLMEIMGRISRHDVTDQTSFEVILNKLGPQYQLPDLAPTLYEQFRHGIAHSSLAKGGVLILKTGDQVFHLSNSGKNIDVRLMFEDYMVCHKVLFENELTDQNKESYYEENLRRIFRSLNFGWLSLSEPDLFATRTFTTVSGVRYSGASGVAGPTNLGTTTT